MSRRNALLLALLLGFCAQANANPDRDIIHSQGRTLQMQISGDFNKPMQETLREWIASTARALEGVYGHWPNRHWTVSVEPLSASGEDPIPWAQVHREEKDRVEFFVKPNSDLQSLRGAYTGYHEMSHLLIPYRGWGGAWFSEGLATYYQNLLQARTGIIDEREMWQRIYEGFQRGYADKGFDGQPLSEVSKNMRVKGGFMRVYWSGTWYFLQADMRLRRQSGGELNLDLALKKLNDCCAGQRMSAERIIAELDRLNQVYLFAPLAGKVRTSTRVPPYEPLFASLGISVRDGTVALAETGPGAELRRQIASPGTL